MNAAADAAKEVADSQPFATRVLMNAAIDNFKKMLGEKPPKVRKDHPDVKGGQAGTEAEATKDGKIIRTAAVGAGGEVIYLGPGVLHPASDPKAVGQKVMHEGLRTKEVSEYSQATMQPGGAGPGGGAPREDRCKWLNNEIMVLRTDEAYFERMSAQAAEAGNAGAQRFADRSRQLRANKRQTLEAERTRLECN